jgi:phage terminase large subunit
MNAQFPGKLKFLFDPARYKVAYGGRGSGKSWGFARALLILGAKKKTRILCTREVQKSIKDSVHKLLSDQIKALGLERHYQILETQIRGKNGTEIFFSGLSNQTADSIKSFESVNICWVEEAQTVSKKSWDVLRPTIRADESEIWVTFNPDLETDPTYEAFVTNQPADCVTVEMNWHDNPWFTRVLEAERIECLEKQPKDYPTIWEGKCRPAVQGAIYYDEIVTAVSESRIRSVPINPTIPVHRVWDLGYNDLMSIILTQRIASEIAIVGYITGQRRILSDYIAEMKNSPRYSGCMFGTDYLPHDGFATRHQTGRTDADVLRGLGCTVEETPHQTVEQGIRQARLMFPRVYIDAEATQSDNEDMPGLVECLKRYRRHINAQTLTAGAPVHDVHSNGADAFRYLALVADSMPSSLNPHMNHAVFSGTSYLGRAPATSAGY